MKRFLCNFNFVALGLFVGGVGPAKAQTNYVFTTIEP
jgi:hypothetical protein